MDIIYLSAYTQAALELFEEAYSTIVVSKFMCGFGQDADNQVTCSLLSSGRPIDVGIMKRKLAEGLMKLSRSVMHKSVKSKAAVCLSFIVTGNDDVAKEKFGKLYDALKGRPLDVVKTIAVSMLMDDVKTVHDRINDISGDRDVYDELCIEQEKLNELEDKILAMRGDENYSLFELLNMSV
jgi:hypothetical protein